MITKIIHQIWNERKENAWIFLELFVVSICIWLAIDPLFNITSRNSIDKGYDAEDVYIIDLERYKEKSRKHDTRFEGYSNQEAGEKFIQMLQQIESLPEVESYALLHGFPGGNTASYNNYIIDSTMRADNKKIETTIKYFSCYETENSNFFATYGIADARTNKIIEAERGWNYIYISESLAKELFGTDNAIGKEIEKENNYSNHKIKYTVKGIFKDVQVYTYHAPDTLAIFPDRLSPRLPQIILALYDLHIKVKKGTDKDEFEKKFRNEIMPTLRGGNIYCHTITSHAEKIKQYEKMQGITNKYRKNIILSSFALLCALLGIIGTFWVRAVARRQEIGIMQSVGATRATIVGQFVTEAAMLATIAFALATPLLIHYIYVSGFAEPMGFHGTGFKPIGETLGWYNKPVPHFLIVSGISYLFIMAVCAIGAALPVAASVKSSPADALKE
ncbi:MAG: FtsX-like permease family protein [Bacteroidaceae bacterium]|nr:FtsX-like permease family protein [Bacteroidaceae bacterium]